MLDTGLKHILKEEFCVYYKDTSGKRKYVYYISNGVNSTEDIDDALKLKTLDAVKGLIAVAREMSSDKVFKTCHIQTIVEDVDLDSKKEDEF